MRLVGHCNSTTCRCLGWISILVVAWMVFATPAPCLGQQDGPPLADTELPSIVIWLALVVIVAQATTIVLLVLQRRKRRQAEAVLRLNEARYQELFDNAPVGYHEIDRDGTILRVNQTEAAMLGYAVEEMVGRPVFGFLVESDRDTARQAVAMKFTGELPLRSFDRTFLKRDGSRIPVRIEEQFVKDDRGEVVGIRSAVTDVTRRKEAETKLRQSESRMRTLLDVTRDVVYMLKLDPLGYDYVSPGTERLLGFDAGQVEQRGPEWFVGRMHPEDRAVLQLRLQHIREGAVERDFAGHREHRWQHADGHWIWLSDNHTFLRDDQGKPVAIVGTIRDITEQRHYVDRLAESERRFRGVLEVSRDMVYRLDLATMHYDYISPACLPLLGYTTEEVAAQGAGWYNSRIHPEDAEQLVEVFDESTDNFVPTIEYRWMDRDGEYRWLSDSRALVRNAENVPVSIVGAVRDVTDEKRAQEVLDEATRTATEIVQYIPSGLFIYQYTEPDKLHLLAGNPEAARLTGLDIEQARGREFNQIWTEAEQAGIKDDFLAVLHTGEPYRRETVDYRDERTEGVFRIHAFPMPGERLGVAFEEIGKQHRTEQALQETEQRYRTLFNRMIDAFALHEVVREDGRVVDYRFVEVNPAFTEQTGLEADRVEGRRAREVLPQLEEMWIETYAQVVDSGRSARFEHYQRQLDRHFQVVAFPAGPDRFATIFADITDRVRAQQALEAEKERLRVTLMSIGDGVISTDARGHVLMMNPVAQKLTGTTQDEAEGRPLEEVFRIVNEKTRQSVESPVRKVLEEDRVVGLANHTVLIAADGAERAIADSGAPIRDHRGQVIGVVLVFRDVTGERAMEDQMLKAQKLESVGLLAGGIAHDFNNFLTAILGNLSLARVSDDPDRLQQRLAEAERAAKWARDLTQQLLTFAKGGQPVKQVVDARGLIHEAATFALRGKGVLAEVELPEDLWPLEVDPGQINQAIHNLAVNAAQASDQGGTVRFCADNLQLHEPRGELAPGRYVRLQVIDRGCGISPADLDRVFDPYFSTKTDGSGLGLTTTYSIVKNHDGAIEVDSRRRQGSTFTLYLPAAEGSVEQPGDLPEPQPGQGRVLVMDDEEMVRDVSSTVLRDLGYDVDVAADGRQALQLYHRAMDDGTPYDVVISDLTVPGGMGGREMIDKLLELDPSARAIVSSGYSNDPVLSEPNKYGFKGIVAKPYEVNDLAREVQRVMGLTDDDG